MLASQTVLIVTRKVLKMWHRKLTPFDFRILWWLNSDRSIKCFEPKISHSNKNASILQICVVFCRSKIFVTNVWPVRCVHWSLGSTDCQWRSYVKQSKKQKQKKNKHIILLYIMSWHRTNCVLSSLLGARSPCSGCSARDYLLLSEVNWLPAQERVSHIHLTATGSFLPGFTSPNTEASQNPHLIPFFISAGSCHNTVQYNSMLYIILNSGCHQCDEIRITNCTESGKSENFRGSQWRKFCQHDIFLPALSGNRSRIYLLRVGLIIESRTDYVSNKPKKNFLYIYAYGGTDSSNNWNPRSAIFYTTQGVPVELGNIMYLCCLFMSTFRDHFIFPNVNNVHYSVVYFVLEHRWRRHSNDMETSPNFTKK